MSTAPDARRIDRELRQATGPIRPASILRIHEPDSPESIYLREQATRLKDSRALAERLADAAEAGLAADARLQKETKV